MDQSKTIKKKFNTLDTHQQELLKLMALIDAPISRSKLVKIASKSKVKDQTNRVYNTVSIGKELESLRSNNWVRKTMDQRHQLQEKHLVFLLPLAIAQKRLLKTRRAAIEEALPGLITYSPYNRTEESMLRDLCFYIFTNNFELFEATVREITELYPTNLETVYNKFFVQRYGKENIHQLDPAFQLEFHRINLHSNLFNLEDVTETLAILEGLMPQLDSHSVSFINYYQTFYALLKGDWSSVLTLWNGSTSTLGQQFLAWLNFAQGNNKQALEYYKKALKAFRKKQGSRKAYFNDYHGLIYILALLKEHNTNNINTIKPFLKESFSYGLTNHLLISATLIDALQNNKEKAEDLFSQEFLYYNFDGLFYLYAQHWTQTYAPNWKNYAYTLHHKALKNGYYWVAYNIAVLMQRVDDDKIDFYNKSAADLYEKLDKIPSIIDIVTVREEWEIALQALESLNTQAASNNKQPQATRLIWLVDFETLNLQPKIQKINKSGRWSKGRNVSLNKLAYGEIEEATAHDNRVARTLSKEYGWYNNTAYGFHDIDKTLKALIDHPLLFLMDSPEIGCELLKGTPELIVQDTPAGFLVQTSISLDQFDDFIIQKETPTRYKYIEITPKHLELAEVLNHGQLLIPKQGQKKLEQTLTRLSSVIPIQSDLDYQNENLPTVEADQRIFVHLLPIGDQFQVELFVKPFTYIPPYHKPGKGASKLTALIDDTRKQTKRDLLQEQKAVNQLKEVCTIFQKIRPKNGTWQLETPYECLQLLNELEALKKEDRIVVEWPKGEKIKIKQQISFDNLSLSISKQNDWFGISGKVVVDEHLVLDMRQLLNMMQQQKSDFIALDDGQFLALSEQLKKQLDRIHKFTDDNGKIHPLAGFALDDLGVDFQDLKIDQAWDEHINKLKTIEKKRFNVPKGLNATLRSYQKEGFQWLAKLADWGVGACLADDMGLGKTIQALTVILQRSAQGPSLVVAPASVCRNWMKEIEKFAPSLFPVLFRETNRERAIKTLSKHQVLITTYGLLQSESELFASQHFTTIVLDEAQAIKNSSAKRSQAAMQLQGDFKIITTGTPIENHLSELWNLFRFINPGLLGSMKSFRNRFAIPIEKEQDEDTQVYLQRLIRPFILRRHKKDVLTELPEKTEITLSVELSDKEQAFYEALRRQAVESLKANPEEQTGTKHLKILAQLMRLRRACCNPLLVDPTTSIPSSKLNLFGEIVDELLSNGHKALVFSQFVGHLHLIEQYIKNKGIHYQYLDGQTPTKQRQKRIDAFQDGSGDLFLISLKAGGTGLNLTAADYVIHMDPWWNPAVEDQASDRAHRIGQKRPVTVYRLITQNTIEEKIIKLHESKRDLADSLLKGTDASSKLSANDLLDLIKHH